MSWKANFKSNPEMMEKCRNLVKNDLNAFLRIMERGLKINKETIRIRLNEDVGKTEVSSKVVPQTLTDDQKSARDNHFRKIIAAIEMIQSS